MKEDLLAVFDLLISHGADVDEIDQRFGKPYAEIYRDLAQYVKK